MKKVIATLFISFLTLCSNAQQVILRNYPNSIYKVHTDGETRKESATISVYWKNNDADNIDKIDGVGYPGGYVLLTSYFKYLQTIDGGFYQYQASAKDEGRRDVLVVATKYSDQQIGIIVYYSKNLAYSMVIDLTDYRIQID